MTKDDRPIGEDDLDAYVDGRLSPHRAAEVEAFLRDNPALEARVAADCAARDELRQRLAFIAEQPIPARLHVAAIRARRRAAVMHRLRLAAACVGLVVLGGAAGWQAHDRFAVIGAAQRVLASTTADAIAAHRIFVVETAHPVEVAAAQQQHLVQWLSRRVGHKLTVPDLAPQGFSLMGGRVLPAGSVAAAQFMYENRNGQRLTLYVRASTGEDTEFRFVRSDTVGAFSWVEEGLGFAMVAAMDREALLALAEVVYRQLDANRAQMKPPI